MFDTIKNTNLPGSKLNKRHKDLLLKRIKTLRSLKYGCLCSGKITPRYRKQYLRTMNDISLYIDFLSTPILKK